MGGELSVTDEVVKDSVFSSSPSISRGKTGSLTPRRRARSFDSTDDILAGGAGGATGSTASDGTGGGWGWFDESSAISAAGEAGLDPEFLHQPIQRSLSLPPPVTEPPLYVLESPISTQHLWYSTAGQRPKQPEKERLKFEKLWRENFARSSVEGLSHGGLSQKEEVPEKDFEGEIVYRGKAPFSNAVSKSFEDIVAGRGVSSSATKAQQSLSRCWNSVTIQLPRFRIVRDANGTLYAEFLVVVSLQGVHNSYMTFGVWRRHSAFENLSRNIDSSFKNASLSWTCFVTRKRWFRCLEIDYLKIKCFLLERFLHDVLFESTTASLIAEFLDLKYDRVKQGGVAESQTPA